MAIRKAVRRRVKNIEAEMLWAVSMASYLMAQVDGDISDEEYDLLGQSLADMTEGTVTAAQLNELLDTHAEIVDKLGFDGAAQELAKRLPVRDARRAALLYAAGVAFSDGVIEDDEEDAFSSLAEHLGFSQDEAVELVREATGG